MFRGPANSRPFPYRRENKQGLDDVRAGESRRMTSEGRTPLLKKSRWLLLKREEKAEQRFRLPDLLRYNLKAVRAYLLKRPFSNSGSTARPPGPANFSTSG